MAASFAIMDASFFWVLTLKPLQLLPLLTDFSENLQFACNSMFHCLCKILLKSDICFMKKIHGFTFFRTRCRYMPKPTNIAKVKTASAIIWNRLPQEFIENTIISFYNWLNWSCVAAAVEHCVEILIDLWALDITETLTVDSWYDQISILHHIVLSQLHYTDAVFMPVQYWRSLVTCTVHIYTVQYLLYERRFDWDFIHVQLQIDVLQLHIMFVFVGRLGGYRSMCRLLRQKHRLMVPHETVRQMLKQIDPAAVSARRQHRLNRRSYFSRGPNDMWHIDGYDKLQPYGIMISGFVKHVIANTTAPSSES